MPRWLHHDRRIGGDDGYALLSVIGLATAILLSVGAVSAFSVQAIKSAGSTQGFHASVQAAQAGVDQFVAKLNAAGADGTTSQAEIDAAVAAGATYQPVPAAVDGEGVLCSSPGRPANCPEYRYEATQVGTGFELTSYGRSRGDVRAVKVTLRQRALTDYLYYSAVEAADPADPFVYPALLRPAPPGCEYPAWNSANPTQVRPPSGCTVPTWRTGDSTDGSRVHTSDVFGAVGTPSFDSRVSVAIPSCATNPATCVVGGNPTYQQGGPSYADDLTLPGPEGLNAISAAATQVGNCTYYGPTRIKFEGDQMRVWSPQTPADPNGTPANQRCGGGVDPTVLNTPINVVVTLANRTGICNLLGILTQVTCALLHPVGSVVQLPLSDVLSNNLLTGLGLSQELAGVAAQGNLVNVRSDMAIHVRDNPVGTGAGNPPDPTAVQCLAATSLGMYGSLDTNLTAGLLDLNNNPLAACRTGKLFVDGTLDGQVSIGVSGAILIVGNQTYAGSDDRLGMVATGPIEVYNSLQCTLAGSTCLSLSSLDSTVLNALNGVRSAAWTGNLTTLLQTVPGYGQNRRVDASLISLQSRVGVQLPVLAPNLSASLINQLVSLNITPPTLTINGSIAQKYRGLTSADLLSITASVSGSLANINLASVDTDIGYRLKLAYDGKLRTDPPPYLPAPATSRWDIDSFAEVSSS